MEEGKVNGERNLAKTSFFRPRYFLRAWKERRRQLIIQRSLLRNARGNAYVHAACDIFVYSCIRPANLEASRGGRETTKPFDL